MTESMLQYVLDSLQRCKGRWSGVAEETGVSKRTIEKIAGGEIADPGVRKIERLARYFRGREDACAGPVNGTRQRKQLQG